MRCGNDYGTRPGWAPGGMDRGAFRGRGGDYDTYSRREFPTGRGGFSDELGGRGYGSDYGGGRGGMGRWTGGRGGYDRGW